jgi:hypothetical protein
MKPELDKTTGDLRSSLPLSGLWSRARALELSPVLESFATSVEIRNHRLSGVSRSFSTPGGSSDT